MKLDNFKEKKKKNEMITMLTAYDCFSGQIAQQCGVDLILVGDSLGMVIKGEASTINVSLDEVVYHTKAVRKGAADTFIIADMPYMTYHLDVNTTKLNAAKLIIEGKANAVKLEGGTDSRIEAIKALIDCQIPVCGHLGLTPQSINMFGDYRLQAKVDAEQEILIQQALAIEAAGAFMLVLECIPEALGKKVSEQLSIPVIGIGAGRFTDGQVMVWHDILGMSDIAPKFVKKYVDLKQIILENVTLYVEEVNEKRFPQKENVYLPSM